MKSLWRGSLSFGLVNIPVQLFSATISHALDFDMLDKSDHAQIKYQRVNEKTGKEVPWSQIVKGYLLDREYVILDDTDFEQASPKKSKLIEIEEFVEISEISSIFYETAYYIIPDKGNTKAYSLFLNALKKTGKVGVARFIMRSSENLALIQAGDNCMLLIKIRFQDEIRSTEELDLPVADKFTKMEMDMATDLIEQYSSPFDPAKFKNEYKNELLSIIHTKVSGKKSIIKKLKFPEITDSNLFEELKASLAVKRKLPAS